MDNIAFCVTVQMPPPPSLASRLGRAVDTCSWWATFGGPTAGTAAGCLTPVRITPFGTVLG